MVEGYLAFARGEEGEALAPTDLAALIEEVAETVRRSGGEVETILKSRPIIAIRPQAIRRALANLMENARRYAGRMQVTLGNGLGGAAIVLEDDGPGIPVDEREDVFRPFYRHRRVAQPRDRRRRPRNADRKRHRAKPRRDDRARR